MAAGREPDTNAVVRRIHHTEQRHVALHGIYVNVERINGTDLLSLQAEMLRTTTLICSVMMA